MQLYASATSPYARKVRITLIELGLIDRVKIIPTAPTEDAAYRQVNPLGKIPALRLDDGSVIYDSLVIIDWLDRGGDLIPRTGDARNAELRRHALANGVIDAAFNIAMELRRPEELQSSYWISRWSEAIVAGADTLVRELPLSLTLSAITAVAAADYIAFRLGHLDLDTRQLSNWRNELGPRPSLDRTLPQIELN